MISSLEMVLLEWYWNYTSQKSRGHQFIKYNIVE